MHIQVVIKIILWWKMVVWQKGGFHFLRENHSTKKPFSTFESNIFDSFFCCFHSIEALAVASFKPKATVIHHENSHNCVFTFLFSSFFEIPSFFMLWFKWLITIYCSFLFPSALSHFLFFRFYSSLWLCHNELQNIEDMSSIAKSINLKEITIENNPISLAGDCVSFLVSYLPLLNSLNQLQITEQGELKINFGSTFVWDLF